MSVSGLIQTGPDYISILLNQNLIFFSIFEQAYRRNKLNNFFFNKLNTVTFE